MAFLPQEIIRRKRDRQPLEPGEIGDFIRGVTDDRVSEGQIAAFAMAVFLNGMAREEIVALTLAMRDSGDVLAWPGIERPIADKHSTGGVGDNVSLTLAPIVSACGLAVPMISGRGLGHTGGTLDKMESIPGYSVTPDNDVFRRVVTDIGCAIIGQTGDLAPADRRIYGVRDVTATVESIPLITASILSKKLAAGLQNLVLDVKTGSGAFMGADDDARSLARSLVEVANGAGLATVALVTDMNEPLASAAGNAVEVRNAVDFLTGARRDDRLEQVVLALAAEMLMSSAVAGSAEAANKQAMQALNSGQAAERFGRMVAALGGPTDFVEQSNSYLPEAPVICDVTISAGGHVASVDTRGVGLGVVALGGGRTRPQDDVDHAVGYSDLAPVGAALEAGDRIGRVHARLQEDADAAAATLIGCYQIEHDTPSARPVILDRIAV